MNYHSTRNANALVDSAQAVLSGLAPDGGLYVPQALPRLDVSYALSLEPMEMAAYIIGAMLPDIPEMDTLVKKAYTGKFTAPDLTPTVQAGPYTVLELFHGPTCAFKDVALCMLPQLLTAAKTQKGQKEEVLILTATSGDTGKAALEGFRDVDGVKICVFYPHGGVSQVQRLQMATQAGSNVRVLAVEGNFDDAQTGVKNIFAAFGDRPTPGGRRLSTANSINIGRLAPQITYYFKAYRDLLTRGQIQMGDAVNFCVPTGNFGDILAGFLAKKLGLPVGKLICASNANRVLTDFIRTGIYDRRRPLHKTVSPSMDILVSSNLERLLYFISGDTALVAQLMEKLSREGAYQVPAQLLGEIQELFAGYCCDDNATCGEIARIFTQYGYLCDTHTATAFAAAEAYREDTGDERPLVVLSTASPYKFPAAVLGALEENSQPDEFAMMTRLEKLSGVPVPGPLAHLQDMPVRHREVIAKKMMTERMEVYE